MLTEPLHNKALSALVLLRYNGTDRAMGGAFSDVATNDKNDHVIRQNQH